MTSTPAILALLAVIFVGAIVHANLRIRHARCKATLARVRGERDELRANAWARVIGKRVRRNG